MQRKKIIIPSVFFLLMLTLLLIFKAPAPARKQAFIREAVLLQ